MNVIRLKEISKIYLIYAKPQHRLKEILVNGLFRSNRIFHHDFWALKNINLEISAGEAVGIIGQNGSGKSTLLQIITGVLQPTSGVIQINGRISALLELGAGFNPEFTGRENVFINGQIMGFSHKEIENRIDDIIDFADIGEFFNQPVKTYSSGMYVRLAFATAITVDPDILIVDEALAVGDAMFQARCYRKMEKFKEEGKTIIFVSHDLQTIKSFCNRAILMDSGEIIHEGDPKHIVNIYTKMIATRDQEYFQSHQNKSKDIDIRVKNSKQRYKSNDESYHYGTKAAEINKIDLLNKEDIATTVFETGGVMKVRVRAHFKKDMTDPVMGMGIRTTKGIELCGTNTWIANYPTGYIRAGEDIYIEYEHRIILNPGYYVLSVSVAELAYNNLIFLDRRVDCALFKIIGNEKYGGLVDMKPTIRLLSII